MAKTKVHGEYLKDSVVRFTAKAGENITKGQPVYISGISGELPVVSLADADNTAKMPAFGLAEATVSTNGELEVTSFGTLAGLDTSSYSLGDILYVDTTAGALTNNPSGLEATKLQNIGIVQRVHASNGSIKVGGAGRTNAVPNLDDGDIFIGDSNNKAISSSLATEIESYLDGGTSSPVLASLTVDTDTLYVDSTNNRVGIGTSSPAEILEFDRTSGDMFIRYDKAGTFKGLVGISDSSASGSSAAVQGDMILRGQTNLLLDTGGTTRLKIDSSGNVGIGTSSPGQKLDVTGSTGADYIAAFENTNATNGYGILAKTAHAGTSAYAFAAYSGSNPLMVVRGDGNVGIGTDSPSEYLEFSRTAGKIGWGMNGNWGVRIGYFDDSGGVHGFHVDTKHAGTTTSESRFIVRADSGNVGIGTKSPSGKLDVRGVSNFGDQSNAIVYVSTPSSSEGRIGVGGRTSVVPIDMTFWTADGGANYERMRILSTGGITFNGDTAAANALDDYEEGTWDPTIHSVGGAVSASYSYRSGYYIKIGNSVYVRWGFRLSSISGGSGHAQVTGLPYTSKNYGAYQQPSGFVNAQGLTTDPDGPVLFYVVDNNTKLEGRLMNNADVGLPISYFQTNAWCIGHITYDVS